MLERFKRKKSTVKESKKTHATDFGRITEGETTFEVLNLVKYLIIKKEVIGTEMID